MKLTEMEVHVTAAKSSSNLDGALDCEAFKPEAVDLETKALNLAIIEKLKDAPSFWEVGAPAARAARARREGWYSLEHRPDIQTRTVSGRDGTSVPIRIIYPAGSQRRPTGIYLYIHGGGWTVGAANLQDSALERLADTTGMICVSVEYRLAPEHPYPAAADDCEAAASWLAKESMNEFGTDVLTIGGESAGAHLAALTLLRMRDVDRFSGFCAANLVYGCYDLGLTPSARACGDETRLVMRTKDLRHFVDGFLPNDMDPRDKAISPLYADLRALPQALFTVGTCDPLLDDTLFMHARWIAAGNRAELAVFPGGAHGFTMLPSALSIAANTRAEQFLLKSIADSSSL